MSIINAHKQFFTPDLNSKYITSLYQKSFYFSHTRGGCYKQTRMYLRELSLTSGKKTDAKLVKQFFRCLKVKGMRN